MKTIYQPIEPQQRIEILDLLRGFALLGILFDNILYFSGYKFMPYDELSLFPTYGADENLYQFLNIIIKGKFYRIFAILFGAGCFLQFNKYVNNSNFKKVYRRRLFILLIIGLIHSLIWSGDILFMYALAGFVLILFHNFNKTNILRLSVVFLLFFILSDLILFFSYQGTTNPYNSTSVSLAHTNFPDMKPAEVMHIFRNGNIAEVFKLNIHNLVWKWMSKFPSGSFTNTLGLFLLGYYLASTKFFTEHIKSKKLLIVSLVTGIICTFVAKWTGGSTTKFPPILSNTFYYKTMLYSGQLSLSLFYMSLIANIAGTARGRHILECLKPVGKMALSNYLFQTLMCIIIFYNFAFNLIGTIGLVFIIGIAILLLVVQILLSKIWLKYYRFGPMEWIWRSLTYKKRIHNRYDI
jgi:uncharacterized protein